MIPSFIIHLLEKAINRYLHLAPASLERLATQRGKIAAFNLSDLNFEWFFLIMPDGISVIENYSEEPAVLISGTSKDYIQALRHKKNATLAGRQLNIKGDTDFGQILWQTLVDADIDWEEMLSKYMGDVAAHQIGRFARGIKDFFRQSFINVEQTIPEYLQEELRALVPREEIDDLFDEISLLRNEVDRLAARIKFLEMEAS